VPSLPFDESNTFTPPSAFGPYRVLHQIGSGVLGPVFRTYDPQSDRLVAVKAFRLDLLPEDVARLADGLRRLVGTAGHLAAGLEGTTAYLAMDYHAAETLDVALRHLAPAPIEAALPILRGIADCIDRAWAAGPQFGHGALHPRDVFVTPGTGELNITGFGVGPALEAIGARSPVRRPYTAPERASGDPWDARADVYSLGAIAHELLTGARPAGPGEQDGTLPASMPPEVRVQIRRVLSKALAEVPSHRFASAREFIDALVDPSSVSEAEPRPSAADAASAALANATLTPPAAADAADVESIADVISPAPLAPPAAIAPPPVRRQRMKTPLPVPRPPVRVSGREPLSVTDPIQPPAAPVSNMADAPLRRDDGPARVMLPPLALPPPVPWGPMAAILLAGLVLGAVGGYQLAMQRLGVTAPATTTSAPPVAVPQAVPSAPVPAPTAPAPGDTEVAVAQLPAAQKAEESASKTPGVAAKPAATGRILVRSTPAGAVVAIDGKSAGRTPLTARDLALGSHAVVVSRPGFVSQTHKVTLTSRASSTTLSVTLEPEKPARSAAAAKGAATGSVTVDSRPKGAQVTIDGRAIGVTPLSAPGLTPRMHSVRVELAGHKPVTTSVMIKAGETAKIAVTLEQR
jgi:eukaryotic-like serine/threonine-protein kinase